MLMRALGRLIMVPLGFLLGAAAAVFILVSLGSERFTKAMRGRDTDIDTWLSVFDTVTQAWSLISVATIVPAILIVIVGEVARIRSSLYYILGGGAVLAAWPLMSKLGTISADPTQLGVIWQVFATAGFVGGFVYWLVAGRRA